MGPSSSYAQLFHTTQRCYNFIWCETCWIVDFEVSWKMIIRPHQYWKADPTSSIIAMLARHHHYCRSSMERISYRNRDIRGWWYWKKGLFRSHRGFDLHCGFVLYFSVHDAGIFDLKPGIFHLQTGIFIWHSSVEHISVDIVKWYFPEHVIYIFDNLMWNYY